MTQETWTAVDQYLESALLSRDEALEAALANSNAKGLPQIAVSPSQGKMLHLLAKMQGASRILEVGTLGGYSTIWLARALPTNGHLTTLELDPKHAAVARENLARSNLAALTTVIEGPALDSLAALAATNPTPFDFVFIDADKPNNPSYFDWALKLTRPGSTIIVDNIVRNGDIIDPNASEDRIKGVQTLLAQISTNKNVSATVVQTVGTKGYDGFLLSRVLS